MYRVTQTGCTALRSALGSPTWAENRTPTAFDTWLGLSIHAPQPDRARIIGTRRAFLLDQLKKERATLAAISSDPSQRARIAAVMVGWCIDRFEMELTWLDKALPALEAG